MKKLSIFLLLNLLATASVANDIVGKWRAISGNEYRETPIELNENAPCWRPLFWHFDADGVHTVNAQLSPCEIKNEPSVTELYKQKYRYKLEEGPEFYLLKKAILLENANNQGLAEIVFVDQDVFKHTNISTWNDSKGETQYFKRVHN